MQSREKKTTCKSGEKKKNHTDKYRKATHNFTWRNDGTLSSKGSISIHICKNISILEFPK